MGERSQLPSTAIEIMLAATPEAVFDAVLEVARLLWGFAECDIVTSSPPSLLVHSVQLDGATSCWLSWELADAVDGTTRLRLVHDEADLDPGPAPELAEVMTVLKKRLAGSDGISPPQPTGEASP